MNKLITPNWPAPKNIRAYSTTKACGNLALHVGDDRENTLKNRELLNYSTKTPEDPRWLTQTHSNIALQADSISNSPTADASFTSTPNVICVVLTGDCLPILLCNQQGTEVAAIHAGWKGIAANIIQNTINAMSSSSEELMAWIGPGISQNVYEVGEDFKSVFKSLSSDFEPAFNHTNNKIFANLYQIASIQLHNLSIKNVYTEDFCTYTDTSRFYSARRDGINTGRMATLIWQTKEN